MHENLLTALLGPPRAGTIAYGSTLGPIRWSPWTYGGRGHLAAD
ncbi:hypothetical protein [Microtetraspora glauca]|uniref:Uncharacterized protein n=1 Tax=Microtetraspora glauca TaxID=1996 RepID=A0ABV3GCX9_MICGL